MRSGNMNFCEEIMKIILISCPHFLCSLCSCRIVNILKLEGVVLLGI